VFVVATTREKQDIDPALLRPGRIETTITLSGVDALTSRKILDEEFGEETSQTLYDRCTHLTGAEIRGRCREAKLRCLRLGADHLDVDILRAYFDRF